MRKTAGIFSPEGWRPRSGCQSIVSPEGPLTLLQMAIFTLHPQVWGEKSVEGSPPLTFCKGANPLHEVSPLHSNPVPIALPPHFGIKIWIYGFWWSTDSLHCTLSQHVIIHPLFFCLLIVWGDSLVHSGKGDNFKIICLGFVMHTSNYFTESPQL